MANQRIDTPLPKFRGLVIPPSSEKLQTITMASLEQKRAAVGGQPGDIPAGVKGLSVYADDDGRRKRLPRNVRASVLFQEEVFGPVLCCGPADKDGQTDLPEDVEQWIRRHLA